jgi:hypothetical protein
MSLEHINWRYVGSQSFASATVAAVHDATYTLGIKTTYANGATRTEGTGSAWTFTGNRYQNTGTTEALYPAPPTSTLNGRILLAGAATLPSPNPTMASPDAAAANILLANVVKNAGAFATWNAASPMTSGQTFGYWRVWPTSAGTGSVYLYEGKDALLVVVSAGAAAYAWIGGAIGDPETDSTSDGESDGKVYGQAVSGTNAVWLANWFGATSATTSGFPLVHATGASQTHIGVFTPGGSTILTATSLTGGLVAMTTTGLKTRSGRWARAPLLYRYTAAAPNDGFAFRLREVFAFSDETMGRTQTNGATTIGYVAGPSATTNQDALLLEHG